MTAIEDARAALLLAVANTSPGDKGVYVTISDLEALLHPAPPTDDEREALAEDGLTETIARLIQQFEGDPEEWRNFFRDAANAILVSDVWRFRRQGPITSGDDPVPRYAQCDLWQALFGVDTSGEYEAFREEQGYADTWSWLLDQVRRRQGPITDAQVEAALAAWVESAIGGASFDAMADYLKERNRPRMRVALEAARDAS